MPEPKKKAPPVKAPAKSVSTAGASDPHSVKPASSTNTGYTPTKKTRKSDRFEIGPGL